MDHAQSRRLLRQTAQKHGLEELPLAQGQGQRPRGGAERSYPTPEVRGGGRDEQPHVQGARLHECRRAERSYSMFKVRRGGGEEIPLV